MESRGKFNMLFLGQGKSVQAEGKAAQGGSSPYVEYIRLAAAVVLGLVFMNALLMWGEGLTVNINIISGGNTLGFKDNATSSSAIDEGSLELLRALEFADTSKKVPRPFLFLKPGSDALDLPAAAQQGQGTKLDQSSVNEVPKNATQVGSSAVGVSEGADSERQQQKEETSGPDDTSTATNSQEARPGGSSGVIQAPEQVKLNESAQVELGSAQKEETSTSINPPPGAAAAGAAVGVFESQRGSEEEKHAEAKGEEQKAAKEQKQEQEQQGSPAAEKATSLPPEQLHKERPGGERDWKEVARLKELTRPLAKNNTVVVVPANKGFLDMALNLLCRLRALGAEKNVLFWALDRESSEKFQQEGVAHYYDPALFSISNAKDYHHPDYIRMMSERPRVWWRLLATGYDMQFLDADVVAFQSPEKYFDRVADLEGQVDGWGWQFEKSKTSSSNLCAGAFWIRSSQKSLEFMLRAFDSFEERQGKVDRWDDQLALNWVIHTANFADVITSGAPEGQKYRNDVDPKLFRVAFSDPEKILPGHLFWATKREGSGYDTSFSVTVDPNNTSAPPLTFRPSLFHLNGHGKKDEKVERLKRNGWWELNEQGKCRGSLSESK